MWRVVHSLIRRIKRRYPTRSLYCSESVLLARQTGGQAQPALSEDCKFSVADRDDLEAICKHPEALSQSVYSRRAGNGDICFCMKSNGEIASYLWARFTSCCVLCGRKVAFEFTPLKKHQAFTYDFYTYKKFRGRGIGSCLKKAMLYDLGTRGIRDVYAVVRRSNLTPLGINLRQGYQPVGLVNCVGIFGWTKVYSGSDKEYACMQGWIREFSKSLDTDQS